MAMNHEEIIKQYGIFIAAALVLVSIIVFLTVRNK